jgi:hypothetical protein
MFSFKSREKYGSRVFDNTVLRKIRPKQKKTTGEVGKVFY